MVHETLPDKVIRLWSEDPPSKLRLSWYAQKVTRIWQKWLSLGGTGFHGSGSKIS
jgi:hypothetical protein